MRRRRRELSDDAVHVTRVETSPLVPVLIVVLVLVGALVTAAVLGNERATLILAALGGAALVIVGVLISNTVRRSERRIADEDGLAEQRAWRRDTLNRLEVMDDAASVQAKLALTTSRAAGAALRAAGEDEEAFDVIDMPDPNELLKDL